MKTILAWVVIGFVAGVTVTGGAWAYGEVNYAMIRHQVEDGTLSVVSRLIDRLECRTVWIGLSPGYSSGGVGKGMGHAETKCGLRP